MHCDRIFSKEGSTYTKEDNPDCIYCNSPHVIKKGFAHDGMPRYKCMDCFRVFSILRPPKAYSMQFIEQIRLKHICGQSQRALASEFHMSRSTIKSILEGKYVPLEKRPEFKEYIKRKDLYD